MTTLLNETTRAALSAFVTARLGLRFPPDRWDELETAVRAACRHLGVQDVIGWVNGLLVGLPTFAQLQTLANQLTIGETYFFRQGEVFQQLREQLLPELWQRRQTDLPRRPLSLWSAACSTGEEPYSLAILLRETLPDLVPSQYRVVATDLNSQSLARAAQATYSHWSFRDAPPWLRERYFTPGERGMAHLRPAVREMVRFARLNLVEDAYPVAPGGFDFIFCRNVLMYFSNDWQDVILQRLWQSLAEDGYLVVGPCGTSRVLQERFRSIGRSTTVYQKRRFVAPEAASIQDWKVPEPTSEWAAPAEAALPWPEATPAASEPSQASQPDERPAVEPSLSPALVQEARAAADRGALEEALQVCDRAVAADKLDASAHFLQGSVLQELRQPRAAAGAFRRVLYLEPDHILAHFALASLAREAGEAEQARRGFRQTATLLRRYNRGDALPGADGWTAARLEAVIAQELQQAEVRP